MGRAIIPTMRQLYMVDGRVVEPGQLVETRDGWVEPAPVRCPAGHVLENDGATVGWVPCRVGDRGGHRTHQCEECGGVVYTPPRDEICVCADSLEPPCR